MNSVGMRVISISLTCGSTSRRSSSMKVATRLPSPIEEMKLVGLTT